MGKTNYAGIDYSLGMANIDRETGIRFGVIPAHRCTEWIWESYDPDYGAPHCPHCGNEARSATEDVSEDVATLQEQYETDRHACGDYACDDCARLFDGDSTFGDEALGYDCTDPEYQSHIDSSGDVWVLKSPYYTRAQFCSPCAPGAAYLTSPCADGPKAYCFAADWFDDDRPCPYPIYSVADDSLIYSPPEDADTE